MLFETVQQFLHVAVSLEDMTVFMGIEFVLNVLHATCIYISHGMHDVTETFQKINDSETLKICTGQITPDVPNDIQGGRNFCYCLIS